MNKKLLLCICTLFLISKTHSQEYNFNSLKIPIELKENANSVIIFEDYNIELKSPKLMRIHVKKAVTVLNKLGDDNRYVMIPFDNTTKIKSYKTYVYNAFGEEIKKVKKSEYNDVSAVDDATLYADNRLLYYRYVPKGYPYTIFCEYVIESSDTAVIPSWKPMDSYLTGVLSSSYTLNYPDDIDIQAKEFKFENFNITNNSIKGKIDYKVENFSAIKKEPYSPPLKDYTPNVKLVSNKFYLEGIYGAATNWEELGKWEYNNLYNNINELPQSTKSKVIRLVEGVSDPIEKAKIIYKYVQDKTRYISVQVGIGGLRPMTASKVDNLGYGDCKGLTNYTKSLLEVVGVKSYFTELYGGYNKLDMDYNYPAIHGNHVILNIPNKDDDIWLECTSQKVPFGFIASFTDDRDVIVIKPEGGVLKHTKKYKSDENTQVTKGSYTVDLNGHINANCSVQSKGIQYNTHLGYFDGKNEKELDILFKKQLSEINNIKFSKTKVLNDREQLLFKEELDFNATNYATISGEQMLLPVNAFTRVSTVPKRIRNRKLPFEISRGYKDIDEIKISIPNALLVEFMPENMKLETKFGNYTAELIKLNETSFMYKRELHIKEGKYPKEDYAEYRKFRKNIRKFDNSKLILKSK